MNVSRFTQGLRRNTVAGVGCLGEKKRWLACLDGGEERLETFLVLHGKSCAVASGVGVAEGGEKKGESETSGEEKSRKT